MPRNLDMALLRTFVAVAELGSMTAAANQLHLTQGAVSQQMRRLAASLDNTLFVRQQRSLALTPEGERLLGRARQLLKINDEIWADMAARPLPGTLRLGVPYDLVENGFSEILNAFSRTHAHVDIALQCGTSPELSDALEQGLLDLAIVEEVAADAEGEVLKRDQLVWVGARGGHAHARRPLPVSMVAETCAFRPAIFGLLGNEGITWRTVFESGNIEATRASVRADMAVTAWLASTVPADMAQLGADSGLPPLPVFAITLRMQPCASPAAEVFGDLVREGVARWSQAVRPPPVCA